jgi:hypothetical protein
MSAELSACDVCCHEGPRRDALSALEQKNRTLRTAINALMAERRALRSFAAALGMPNEVSRSRRHELILEHLRLEGEARHACRTAGFELRNNDQPLETI